MSKRKLLIKLLIILPLFAQLAIVESKTETKKGRGKAFGAGILAGGIAGAAMGHILTRANNPAEVHHHHHHFVETNTPSSNINVQASNPNTIPNPPPPPPPPRPSVTIERGETLENGCYKQIVKEPSEFDITRFVEIEQLICPHHFSIVPEQSMPPVQPAGTTANVESNHAQPPQVPAVIPINSADANVNVIESNHVQPPPVPAAIATNMDPRNIVPSELPRFNHDGASVEPLPLPLPPVPQPGAVVPISGTVPYPPLPVQVITLSKKTGFYEDDNKKKSSASHLLATNLVLILLVGGLGLNS